MPSPADFQLMAQYNQWMNQKVYEAAGQLSDECLNEHKGAFFGSVLGTLNHILVADIIWLKRFNQHTFELPALGALDTLPDPAGLSTILYTVFDELKLAREDLDVVITAFTSQLTEQVLAAPLAYYNTKGEPYTKQLGHLLMHFFNHQTHHRGQVTTLLNQAGVDVGVTDLLALLPDA